MNITNEMLLKAKKTKSAEELILLAKENKIDASEEEIRAYFEKVRTASEISDDELDNVAGGACRKDSAPEDDSNPSKDVKSRTVF